MSRFIKAEGSNGSCDLIGELCKADGTAKQGYLIWYEFVHLITDNGRFILWLWMNG